MAHWAVKFDQNYGNSIKKSSHALHGANPQSGIIKICHQ